MTRLPPLDGPRRPRRPCAYGPSAAPASAGSGLGPVYPEQSPEGVLRGPAHVHTWAPRR